MRGRKRQRKKNASRRGRWSAAYFEFGLGKPLSNWPIGTYLKQAALWPTDEQLVSDAIAANALRKFWGRP